MNSAAHLDHVVSEPAILYFGTPVVLVGTCNEDGSDNLAPISSAFWLGWRCMLGIGAASKTAQNLLRTRECVLNLPSVDGVNAVDRLALTTGVDPVPAYKSARGYRFERDKFRVAGLTRVSSQTVSAPRVAECPVQLEGVLAGVHRVGEDDERLRGGIVSLEVRIQRVHLSPDILLAGHPNRVDPDKWRPLIMSFQKFYGLESKEAHTSRLASIPEHVYRSPDVDRVRRERGECAAA